MGKCLRQTVLYCFLLTTAIGCSHNRAHSYASFPVNISLTGEVIDSDSAMLHYPFRIKHQDSLAVIMDLHHPEFFYHSFTYPGFRYISSFGKRGQAPEENLSIENFRFSGGAMWGLDANKRLIKAMSIQDIYTVFHGRSFKEIAKQQQPVTDGGQFIYVFSLKGEPLVRYTLDRYIYGMVVNEETKELYAVDVNSNLPVVKFKLTRL